MELPEFALESFYEIVQKQPLDVFCKESVLKNFAKFTGKHLCQSLFFNKVAGRPATLFKKRLWHRSFRVNFAKFLRTHFFIEHLRWLLLVLNGPEVQIAKSLLTTQKA